MQEQQLRHQYLDMMGVDSWLARGTLPNTAPSPDWVVDFTYNAKAALPNSQQSCETTQPNRHPQEQLVQPSGGQKSAELGIKSLSASLSGTESGNNQAQAQLMAQDVVSHLPVSEQAPAVSPVTASKSEHKPIVDSVQGTTSAIPMHTPMGERTGKVAPVMRLMFWQFKDVLVIDSLPVHTRGTVASVQYEQLLLNLLNALQMDSQKIPADAQPYVLNWPTLAGDSIDQGWDQAVSAVQHKLAKMLQGYQPKIALLLGEHSAQMAMNLDEPFDDLRGMVFSLRSDIKAIAGYSVTQLLNVPGCKRELWSDLQKVINL